MMLRKSIAVHEDHMTTGHPPSLLQSDLLPLKTQAAASKNSSLFSVPGLFVGFASKALADHDSAKSPTSPLDHHRLLRSPRPLPKFDFSSPAPKVGLGIVDSLDDPPRFQDAIAPTTTHKVVVVGSHMKINLLNSLHSSFSPRSLPKNYGISPLNPPHHPQFNIPLQAPNDNDHRLPLQLDCPLVGKLRSSLSYNGRSSSLLHGVKSKSDVEFWSSDDPANAPQDSASSPLLVRAPNSESAFDVKLGSPPTSLASGQGFVGSLSAAEIELSEDYTCVISRGPNPRTTHIYGDCILESHTFELADCNKKEGWGIRSPQPANSSGKCFFPSDEFLSSCYFCKKKLEGKDIFMYRGEKAFCSCNCRSQEILFEEMDKAAVNSLPSPKTTEAEDIFSAGMAVST